MVGLKRLANIRECVETVLADGVPGDLVETGVWRGGSCIFMRGILAAHGDPDRRVWVCDSFEGLPEHDGRYEADIGDQFHTFAELAIPVEEVQENFRRYGLLDDRVRFLEGWFARHAAQRADRARSRCCASTATCTPPRWTPSSRSTTRSRPAAS